MLLDPIDTSPCFACPSTRRGSLISISNPLCEVCQAQDVAWESISRSCCSATDSADKVPPTSSTPSDGVKPALGCLPSSSCCMRIVFEAVALRLNASNFAPSIVVLLDFADCQTQLLASSTLHHRACDVIRNQKAAEGLPAKAIALVV